MATNLHVENCRLGQSSGSAEKDLSIASVTVAYNGATVLRRHLDSLRRQTRKLNEIVIVNNASTDNTFNLLATEFPEATVLNLPANVGVGGGFAAGIAYAALRNKHDWIWIFDQDSVPSGDGLERLLAGLQHLRDTEECPAILAPVCIHPETGMIYPALSWRGWRFRPTARSSEQPITFADVTISSGSLIRSGAVNKAGLPRADFFMDFVDYEYCLRLRRTGFRIAVVRDSILSHAIGAPTTLHILGRTKYWTDHVPWREYYMARNELFTLWQYYPGWRSKAFTLSRLARHALGLLLFGKQKLACIGMMFRGFLDGRAGRLGIRFGGTTPALRLDSTALDLRQGE